MVGPKTGRPAGTAGPAARGEPLGAALCVAPPVPARRAGASIMTAPALSGVLLPCPTLLAIGRVVRRPRCAPRLSSAHRAWSLIRYFCLVRSFLVLSNSSRANAVESNPFVIGRTDIVMGFPSFNVRHHSGGTPSE
jgi:hypothetical protein